MFSRRKGEKGTTLSVKIAILVAIAAVIILAVILVKAMSWTKPYYRDQHKSSIDVSDPTAVIAQR
jgi:hypothetical protein